MSVQSFLETFCSEFSISPVPKLNAQKCFVLPFAKRLEIFLMDLQPGVSFWADLMLCPQKNKEELFSYLMRANLLGQGTGGSRIGLDEREKSLTLSLGIPYEINYKAFKENLEEFVNHLLYWRDEIANFEKRKSIY